MAKKILVVGANFVNKGAQSMLFIVTDELKKRFPDCEVFFACNEEKYNEKDYTFKRVLYTKQAQDYALGKNVNLLKILKINVKNILKIMLGRSASVVKINDAKRVVPHVDLIVDVSGYALADICSSVEHEYYLDNIRLAKKYNIPMILMPQSFGPFNYSEEDMYLMDEMCELLPYCKAIYAREEDGYEYLQQFKLKNLHRSVDLVLQNKSIDKNNICTRSYHAYVPRVEENSVAIIPNYHCFTEEYEKHSFELYRQIIIRLLKNGKNVYIFRHASFDFDICKQIKGMFEKESRVYLIEREFDCIEYDEFVRQFEFVICSRYHGCVHAYKNHIPNIILGWAVKYRELAKKLGQEDYIFNILSADCDDSKVLAMVERMLECYSQEINTIKMKLSNVQKDNCFDILNEIEW